MNLLAKQLADALREQTQLCPGDTVEACYRALIAHDAAKDAPEDDDLTAAYIAGSTSRLAELRVKDAEIAALSNKLDALQRRTSRHSLAKDLGSAVEGDAAIMARMTAEIAELKRNLGSLRRQINEMDNETGDEVDTAFMQMQRARAAQKKAEDERDYALKSERPNLQPLHELVAAWINHEPDTVSYLCSVQLADAIAKIQSAGEVK